MCFTTATRASQSADWEREEGGFMIVTTASHFSAQPILGGNRNNQLLLRSSPLKKGPRSSKCRSAIRSLLKIGASLDLLWNSNQHRKQWLARLGALQGTAEHTQYFPVMWMELACLEY